MLQKPLFFWVLKKEVSAVSRQNFSAEFLKTTKDRILHKILQKILQKTLEIMGLSRLFVLGTIGVYIGLILCLRL